MIGWRSCRAPRSAFTDQRVLGAGPRNSAAAHPVHWAGASYAQQARWPTSGQSLDATRTPCRHRQPQSPPQSGSGSATGTSLIGFMPHTASSPGGSPPTPHPTPRHHPTGCPADLPRSRQARLRREGNHACGTARTRELPGLEARHAAPFSGIRCCALPKQWGDSERHRQLAPGKAATDAKPAITTCDTNGTHQGKSPSSRGGQPHLASRRLDTHRDCGRCHRRYRHPAVHRDRDLFRRHGVPQPARAVTSGRRPEGSGPSCEGIYMGRLQP